MGHGKATATHLDTEGIPVSVFASETLNLVWLYVAYGDGRVGHGRTWPTFLRLVVAHFVLPVDLLPIW